MKIFWTIIEIIGFLTILASIVVFILFRIGIRYADEYEEVVTKTIKD